MISLNITLWMEHNRGGGGGMTIGGLSTMFYFKGECHVVEEGE